MRDLFLANDYSSLILRNLFLGITLSNINMQNLFLQFLPNKFRKNTTRVNFFSHIILSLKYISILFIKLSFQILSRGSSTLNLHHCIKTNHYIIDLKITIGNLTPITTYKRGDVNHCPELYMECVEQVNSNIF